MRSKKGFHLRMWNYSTLRLVGLLVGLWLLSQLRSLTVGNKNRKAQQKNYYRKNRLTVGMLEELCKTIPDKGSIVEVADKNGLFPEPAIRGVKVFGAKNRVLGLTLLGKFSWHGPTDEDDPEDWDEEDEGVDVRQIVADYQIANDTCVPFVLAPLQQKTIEQDKEDTLPSGIEYLGVINASSGASSDGKDVQGKTGQPAA
jgi:hypothetical protein